LKAKYVVANICYQIFIQIANRSVLMANLLPLISNPDASG